MADKLLKEVEVADLAGMSLSRLRSDRCQKTGIPFVRLGRKSIRYRERDVQAYIEAHRVDTADTDGGEDSAA